METTREDYRIYEEATGRTYAVIAASSEAAALSSMSWGYCGARFERDAAGRPMMVCGPALCAETYRAERSIQWEVDAAS